jgi:hypothetical protein
VCPNGSMGSDFSALDAELDTLSAGPVVDALSLAVSYGGNLAALSDIDSALGELDADGVALHQRVAQSASVDVPDFLAGVSGERDTSFFGSRADEPRASNFRSRDPKSEEIVLPDPLPRSRAELRDEADKSGELLLESGTPQSGSFSLDGDGILPGNRDDTIETSDEELAEADVDLIDLRSESAPMMGTSRERTTAALFDVDASAAEDDAQHESDAAFAELFADATRQDAMPVPRHSLPPPAFEDTEIFDTGGLGYVENLEQSAALADTIGAEELDSAEFEIVMDDDTRSPPSVPPAHPSQPPEKRPSFLGRLFGRKEE